MLPKIPMLATATDCINIEAALEVLAKIKEWSEMGPNIWDDVMKIRGWVEAREEVRAIIEGGAR